MTEIYKLKSILPHSEHVRCIEETSKGDVVTCTVNGKVALWRRQGARDYAFSEVKSGSFHEPRSIVLSVARLRESDTEDVFVSCGSDKKCIFWDLKGGVLQEINGHNGVVCSFSEVRKNCFLTGSFDGTAKFWENGTCKRTLSGEHKYGVEVLSLRDGRIVTASQGDIFIWGSGAVPHKIAKAHDHSIRKLARHPMGFVTCSNDGFVKVWSPSGQNVLSFKAHENVGQTPSYVYSVAFMEATEEFFTCGEDGNCNLFDKHGIKKQTLKHPKYIREIKLLRDGDLATSNGNFVYVFTRDLKHSPSKAVLKQFQSHFENEKKPPAEEIKLSDSSVLSGPGKSDGDVVVVKVDKGPAKVYSWSAALQVWNELGEVEGRKVFDQTIRIEKQDGTSVTLNYNYSDDPVAVANEFCAEHTLSPDHKQQITEYLTNLKNANSPSQPKSLEQNNNQIQTIQTAKKLRTVPIWARSDFEAHIKLNAAAMEAKLNEFNSKILQSDSTKELAFESPEEKENLAELIALVKSNEYFHANSLSPGAIKAMQKALLWPNGKLFPVLDCLRVLVCHPDGAGIFEGGAFSRLFFSRLAQWMCDDVQFILVCRVLANFVAMRRGCELNETRENETARVVLEALEQLVDALSGGNFGKKIGSFVTVFYNTVLWLGKWQFAAFETRVSSLLMKFLPILEKYLAKQTADNKMLTAASLKTLYLGATSSVSVFFALKTVEMSPLSATVFTITKAAVEKVGSDDKFGYKRKFGELLEDLKEIKF